MRKYLVNLPLLVISALLSATCGINSNPPPASPLVSTPTTKAVAPTKTTPTPPVSLTAPSSSMPKATQTPTATFPPPLIPLEALPRIPNPGGGVLTSSQGQRAFLLNDVLFLETSPGAGDFHEIDRWVYLADWSPDGSKLVFYHYSGAGFPPERGYYDDWLNKALAHGEYYLWFAETQTLKPLSELVSNFPPPGKGSYPSLRWSKDSQRLFFRGLMDSEISMADLGQKHFSVITDGDYATEFWDIGSPRLLVESHCGSPCENLYAYNYQGKIVWRSPWPTGGVFAFSPDGKYLINAGRWWVDISEATVDRINLVTGQVQVLWRKPLKEDTPDDYFVPFEPIHLSPNGKFISFNYGVDPQTLYVIDQQGRTLLKLEDSWVFAWQPNSAGLIVIQFVKDGQFQLTYVSLQSRFSQVIATHPNITPDENMGGINSNKAWSPDSTQFIYQDLSSVLYSWQLNDPQAIPVFSETDKDWIGDLMDLTWAPDSQQFSFYFREDISDSKNCHRCPSLWHYQVASGKVTSATLIATLPDDSP